MITNLYQQALEQVHAGQAENALKTLEMFITERPDFGPAWNDAGAVLYSLGRPKEAIRYFQRAVELDNRPVRTFRNLAAAYLAAGQPFRAMQWFEPMRREKLLDVPFVDKIAEAFLSQNDFASAMDVLQRAKQALPEAPELDRRIESLRGRRAKIAFFVGSDGPTFLNDILAYARQRYEVRVFEGTTGRQVHDLMQWSDISWFEWCTDLARIGTGLPKVCRTIVRLHRYEAYLSWPKEICWENVDMLITVGNEWVLKAMDAWVGNIHALVPIVRIPNGVNLDAISFIPRRPGKKIAFVGTIRMVKNPILLLQCMAALKKIDPQYRLYIAGHMQDLLLLQYIEHSSKAMGLGEMIIFEDFQHNIPAWLADKNYIVSTSVIESQGMGILEAMAAGIKPIIHNFPGAVETFGPTHLFNTPDDFCRLICESAYDSESYRAFVERRYPLSQQLIRINELFSAFEKNPWTEQSAAPAATFSGMSGLTV
jgi:glycosyltransferase involved in cell wall biosynthesis